MDRIAEKIQTLKKKNNAIILAHYYQSDEVQDIADVTGDSFMLSRMARDNSADVIVFCGVLFMAESAKILSPQKKVLLPVMDAGCPMADMVTEKDIAHMRSQHPEAAVVCYVNSSARVKAVSDICCTSSNAVRVVRSLKQKEIIFVPDENLGSYVASQLPDKNIITHSGYCIVHKQVSFSDVQAARSEHPGALLLVHPECSRQVVEAADFVGSTAQIIKFAGQSVHKEFIIGTEVGILHTLCRENPDKRFHMLSPSMICVNMKKTSLEDVLSSLETQQNEIVLDADTAAMAKLSLDLMLEV